MPWIIFFVDNHDINVGIVVSSGLAYIIPYWFFSSRNYSLYRYYFEGETLEEFNLFNSSFQKLPSRTSQSSLRFTLTLKSPFSKAWRILLHCCENIFLFCWRSIYLDWRLILSICTILCICRLCFSGVSYLLLHNGILVKLSLSWFSLSLFHSLVAFT